MVNFLISLLALLLTTPAVAQNYFDAEQLSKVRAVYVVVVNHAKDDCLPTADALKLTAVSALRDTPVQVVNTDIEYPHQLLIKVVGAELKIKGEKEIVPVGACTAAVAVNLLRDEYLKDGSVGRVQAFMIAGYTFGTKDQFQEQLDVIVSEYVNALAKQIILTRQKSR